MGYIQDKRRELQIINDIKSSKEFQNDLETRSFRYIDMAYGYSGSSTLQLFFEKLKEYDLDGYNCTNKILVMDSLSKMNTISHPICDDDNIKTKSNEASKDPLVDLINKIKEKKDGNI